MSTPKETQVGKTSKIEVRITSVLCSGIWKIGDSTYRRLDEHPPTSARPFWVERTYPDGTIIQDSHKTAESADKFMRLVLNGTLALGLDTEDWEARLAAGDWEAPQRVELVDPLETQVKTLQLRLEAEVEHSTQVKEEYRQAVEGYEKRIEELEWELHIETGVKNGVASRARDAERERDRLKSVRTELLQLIWDWWGEVEPKEGSLVLTPGQHSALQDILSGMLRQLDPLEAEEYNEALELLGLKAEETGCEKA